MGLIINKKLIDKLKNNLIIDCFKSSECFICKKMNSIQGNMKLCHIPYIYDEFYGIIFVMLCFSCFQSVMNTIFTNLPIDLHDFHQNNMHLFKEKSFDIKNDDVIKIILVTLMEKPIKYMSVSSMEKPIKYPTNRGFIDWDYTNFYSYNEYCFICKCKENTKYRYIPCLYAPPDKYKFRDPNKYYNSFQEFGVNLCEKCWKLQFCTERFYFMVKIDLWDAFDCLTK
ncbi:MAG: hypothetical protein Satyrvirus1_59 [Satyrvirus sp.]|uniref:Uncharacterized protein n=1 Tax=Satyrvirus sp. TaxID=2487771 RepID=A0A3G5AGF1_9VIRU|nr:MAG: hypothetical protein Satyrvirus1_59 [Satyrvirus sp.]